MLRDIGKLGMAQEVLNWIEEGLSLGQIKQRLNDILAPQKKFQAWLRIRDQERGK